MQIIRKLSYDNWFWIILMFTVSFITWGNFFITISSILLLLLWIAEKNYSQKWDILWQRKTPLFLLAIYVVIFIGAVANFPHIRAFKDIWDNSPLLVFALVLGSRKQLTRKQFHVLMLLYIVSIVLNTMFCFIHFLFNSDSYTDIREVSIFMSYIRFSLYTLLAIAAIGYYLFYNTRVRILRKELIFLWISLFWLIFFVIILSSITGFVGLALLFLLFTISQVKKQKHIVLKLLPISIIVIGIWIVSDAVIKELRYFTNPDSIDIEKLDKQTLLGNTYSPFTKNGRLENGRWVDMYVCEKEIREHWHLYSTIPLFKNDEKGHVIYYTLKRYMTSKNLRKDASGLKQLSKEDIQNIEAGCTNYRFDKQFNLSHRIYEVIWEFHNYKLGRSPAGHSVTQRIEFLKCSFEVFKQHMWFGTGVIQITEKMAEQYAKQETKMPEKYWKKPHNQFMLIAVQYGLIGFIIFILSIIGMIIYSRKNLNILSICWLSICLISFFNEDMLDGIHGLVFFSFFASLFLCVQPVYNEVLNKSKKQ